MTSLEDRHKFNLHSIRLFPLILLLSLLTSIASSSEKGLLLQRDIFPVCLPVFIPCPTASQILFSLTPTLST